MLSIGNCIIMRRQDRVEEDGAIFKMVQSEGGETGHEVPFFAALGEVTLCHLI